MKIRNGFVSNSSSASYILTLSGKKDHIEALLNESCEWLLWNDNYRLRTEEDISRTKHSLKKMEEGGDSFLFESKESLRLRLEKLTKRLEFITSRDLKYEELASYAFETFGIKRTDMYNGDVKLEVFIQDETIWLTQKMMAQLFDVDVRTVSEHIQNILENQELQAISRKWTNKKVGLMFAVQYTHYSDYINERS
jgi:hypothetical protein